jgi:nucleoid-associated protein YgaU
VTAAAPQRTTGVARTPEPVVAAVPQPPAPAPAQDVVAVAESHPAAPSGDAITVRSGDTLWAIAERRVGARAPAASVAREVARLSSLNALSDPDLIFAGQRLRT